MNPQEAHFRELSVAHDWTQLERIGQGRCGTVWAARCSFCEGHSYVAMKREDGSTRRSISHEYKMHQKLLRASLQYPSSLFSIPQTFGFLDWHNYPTWFRILPKLPNGYATCNAIVSEKIVPVQASTRRLLVQQLRPDLHEQVVMSSSTNEHCLIRPYLGRRRYHNPETDTEWRRKPLGAFSLRNFPLHLDQMEQLGIDPSYYAIAMADALAFMHWVAEVDGNDVEFVLAQPRYQSDISHHQIPSVDACPRNISILGPHTMWILDFDLCRDLTLDESGIEQACKAFWGNDPWYPRPGRLATVDQKLWDIFEDRFLESSAKALSLRSDQPMMLPRLLMEKIKQAGSNDYFERRS